MRRKSTKEPMQVTSFRLPLDVKAFLKSKAEADKRTMSYIFIDLVRRWILFETEQAKQPKIKK
ncbi:MAG: hypothetical protein KGL39_38305 [Patescibacteria group bacterium]|nr:hypothetical protein [Patescibacteria group bacterium]